MVGARMFKVDVNRPDLRFPLPDKMGERLTGASVERLGRRSKFILAALSSGETLIIHLGMSGRILISGHTVGEYHHHHPAPEKHDHVVFHLSSGARITYNDARRFGAMDLTSTDKIAEHPWLKDLGPEPLGNEFSETYLVATLRQRRMPIKSALLNQKIVAGLGNIYVCEALYRARIKPTAIAANVSPKRLSRLVPIVRDVLQDAIAAGGSSLRDYRQTGGELGYFQRRFQVYDREGEHCQTDGCGGNIRRIVQSGRSSFYCPRCQR